VEAIRLSHENLGAQTIIITTLPLNSNILDASVELFVTLEKHGHPCLAKGCVQWILVHKFGNFTNQILWKSARHLEYTQQQHNGWELSGAGFIPDRLPLPERKWQTSIPFVCAEKPCETEKNCRRNKISTDGKYSFVH